MGKSELAVSVILVALVLLLTSPMDLLMPMSGASMLILTIIIVFFLYASFVWKEHTRDEREELHTLIAGRIAYLSGAGFLLAGILVQSRSHNVDPWLVAALISMIVSKLLGHIVNQKMR